MTLRLKSREIPIAPTVHTIKKSDRKGPIFKISSKDLALGPGATADLKSKIYRDREAIIMIRNNSLRWNLAISGITHLCALDSPRKRAKHPISSAVANKNIIINAMKINLWITIAQFRFNNAFKLKFITPTAAKVWPTTRKGHGSSHSISLSKTLPLPSSTPSQIQIRWSATTSVSRRNKQEGNTSPWSKANWNHYTVARPLTWIRTQLK